MVIQDSGACIAGVSESRFPHEYRGRRGAVHRGRDCGVALYLALSPAIRYFGELIPVVILLFGARLESIYGSRGAVSVRKIR
ncbi:hypothetical protein [Burkholderia multivorans]|uniref:hypothetical protein n=1 Tax=Burkholderia multivorans TaxID=87883 RepID=UPI0011B20A4C|nr:hypothetical protein [Burkholderia multivorans]MBU9144176.1 hypothetical protein [Burkholderia multivorans]MBU9282453.1 hypothetical protein [Burkholderia multivorans]MCA8338196.1 hypothetical protein [Burkholderia multivorans]MDN7477076.1 hypothetical protein [Burkholderia multivorans]